MTQSLYSSSLNDTKPKIFDSYQKIYNFSSKHSQSLHPTINLRFKNKIIIKLLNNYLNYKQAKVNFYVFLILMIIHSLTHEEQRTENEESFINDVQNPFVSTFHTKKNIYFIKYHKALKSSAFSKC